MQLESSLVFVGAASQPHNCAVSQNYFQPEYVIARDAIFQAARTAGIRGNVSTNGAIGTARGVRRIKEPLLFNRILQLRRNHARFNNRDKIGSVNFLDTIHPGQ